MPASHQDSKNGQCTKIQVLFTLELAHKTTTPCCLKGVLRTKDMITNYLDGLEVFFNVYGISLNSSNYKMARVRPL